MDQKRWKKIEAVLDKALDLRDDNEIDVMLTKACRHDAKLYRQVSQFIKSIKEAQKNGFLES